MEINKIIAATKRRQNKHWYFNNLEHLYVNAVTQFEADEDLKELLYERHHSLLVMDCRETLNYKIIASTNDYNQSGQPNAFAFGLKERLGFLTIPSYTECISWFVHELAHCLSGSLVFLTNNQKTIEPDHGPIFQSMLCYCYSLFVDATLAELLEIGSRYKNFEPLCKAHISMIIEHYEGEIS